jgi:hypothetical protein
MLAELLNDMLHVKSGPSAEDLNSPLHQITPGRPGGALTSSEQGHGR